MCTVIVVQKLTHVVWSYLVSLVFGLDPIPTVLGGLLPDLDYHLGHRRFFHNLLTILIVSLATGKYFVPVLAGMLSHVVLDMMTVSGVALLYPLSNRRFRIASFRTGGIFDHFLLALGVLLVLFVLHQRGLPVLPAFDPGLILSDLKDVVRTI